MSRLRNRNGQGVVESLLSIPLVVLSLSAVLFLCYRTVVFYCADFYLHEALLCSNEGNTFDCERILNKQVSKLLLGGNQKYISLARNGSKVHGRLEIRFASIAENFGPPLIIEKQIHFPLTSGGPWKVF